MNALNAVLARCAYAVLLPVSWLLHLTGICAGPLALPLPGFERIRWSSGRLGVWIRFQSAARNVPAYAALLERDGVAHPRSMLGNAGIPTMDKVNYVKAFSLESRCKGGKFPKSGMMIDESSGSSGLATNWVRGVAERNANRRTIKLGLATRVGKEQLFIINAFALGPWATGVNLTLSLAPWTWIKTVGPDLVKIENALLQFGPNHHYVILGYPPFLKQLADRASLDWRDYKVSMLFGGEGMSESMRRYLNAKGIERVYGSYGASDLELNIAGESKLTVALRRLLEQRPDIAARVLQHAGAMPMIFQFNSSEFFFETNADGELLATVCRPRYLSPKIRYNIHDIGHVVRVPELRRLLGEFGITLESLDDKALDLPLLFHYGRSDLSVSYYGCKIPPADIQEALFRQPQLAESVDAFQLRTYEDEEGDKRLVLSLEVAEGALPEGPDHWKGVLFDTLAEVNQDFRESRRMVPAGKSPDLELHPSGTGPFAGSDIRIKRVYIRPAAP